MTRQETCCSSNDTVTADCQEKSNPDIQCSPLVKRAGDLFSTYCRGAGSDSGCGVNSKILTANSKWQAVTVNRLPYFSTVSGKRSYGACYYQISVEAYKYKSGILTILIDNSFDAKF